MGIQSTVTTNRSTAIARIRRIHDFAKAKDYLKLDIATNEPEASLEAFVENILDISGIDTWTNRMLENIMDRPFFRHSIFDNYFVE